MKAGAETQEGGWTPLRAEGALKAVVAACSPCAICTSTATSHVAALLPAPQSHTGEIDVSTDRSCLKGLCGAPTSTSSPAMPSQSPSPQHALSRALTRARWLQKIPPEGRDYSLFDTLPPQAQHAAGSHFPGQQGAVGACPAV